MMKFLPTATLALLTFMAPAFAITVNNLDAVPDAIHSSEGKLIYAEQMTGTAPENGFGTLPAGLEEKEWIQWVAPEESVDRLIITGAKPWGKDGTYIGIACFADTAEDAQKLKKYGSASCPEDDNSRRVNKLFLGVFRWQNQRLQPIARTEEALDKLSLWSKRVAREADDETLQPLQYYSKLDLAPYRIAPDTMAFGVRGGYSNAYSGGGAFYEVLELYIIKGDKIINIFAALVYQYADIAGEWNDDGTRKHDISESKSILKILPTTSDGFHDLQLVNVIDKHKTIFRWSTADRQYSPQP
ncbi:TPA: hypothetical protein OUJ99_002972 [Klebsiella aerogenes]|nr:hypothetical protein [Klebsiella aerogenes]HCU2334682.1 hypothetical protein [Klebsiella aerogenes]